MKVDGKTYECKGSIPARRTISGPRFFSLNGMARQFGLTLKLVTGLYERGKLLNDAAMRDGDMEEDDQPLFSEEAANEFVVGLLASHKKEGDDNAR